LTMSAQEAVMSHVKACCVIVLAVLAWASPAWADRGGACRDESRRFCPKASGPERLRCLESRKAELSPACREHLTRMRAAGEEFKRDCKDDSAKLCSGREGHPLVECLEESLPKLTPACAERFRKIKAERRVVKERLPAVCREDAEKLCAQSSAVQDGVLACLKADAAKLGAACRKALNEPSR